MKVNMPYIFKYLNYAVQVCAVNFKLRYLNLTYFENYVTPQLGRSYRNLGHVYK